jgi:hypothetical protein
MPDESIEQQIDAIERSADDLEKDVADRAELKLRADQATRDQEAAQDRASKLRYDARMNEVTARKMREGAARAKEEATETSGEGGGISYERWKAAEEAERRAAGLERQAEEWKKEAEAAQAEADRFEQQASELYEEIQQLPPEPEPVPVEDLVPDAVSGGSVLVADAMIDEAEATALQAESELQGVDALGDAVQVAQADLEADTGTEIPGVDDHVEPPDLTVDVGDEVEPMPAPSMPEETMPMPEDPAPEAEPLEAPAESFEVTE